MHLKLQDKATKALRDTSEETRNAVCRGRDGSGCGSGIKYKDCCEECPGKHGNNNDLKCHNASSADHGITGVGRCNAPCRDVARRYSNHPDPSCDHNTAFGLCCNILNHYDRASRAPSNACYEPSSKPDIHGETASF